MTEFEQGLVLSGIGILSTFTAIGILIAVIIVLKAFFPGSKTNRKRTLPHSSSASEIGDVDRVELRKRAAAAALAALLTQDALSDSGLGKILEAPRTEWWYKALGRIHRKE